MIHHGARHHYFHHIRLTELRRLYWAHSIRTLAVTMTTIFVPIYLYRLGFTLTEILTYFLVMSVAWALVLYPAMRLANAIGFNRAMGLSMVFYGVQILMLATLPQISWPLWLLAVLFAIAVALYWPQFRASFAYSLLHTKVTGTAVGLSSALTLLAYGLAPAIGGAIATYLGIWILYVLAMACLVVAALPLMTGPDAIRHQPFRLRDINLRRVWPDLTANAGGEVDDVVDGMIWPLFIFLLVPTYVGVGILSSVTVMASIAIALYTGRNQATHGTASYLKGGTTIISLNSMFRMLTQSAGQIAGVNFLGGLGHALTETPFNSRYYQNADQEPLLPYMFYMQFASALGDILLFGALLIFSLFASIQTVLLIGLLIAAPCGFAMRYMRG